MKLIHRNCPLCNSIEQVDVYQQPYASITALNGAPYTHHIVICKNCGFTFSNPSLAPEVINEYYQNYSNYENPQRDGKESVQMLNKWNRTIALTSSHFPPSFSGRVLEVGCSVGTGLSVFKQHGWQVLGIEPSLTAAQIARRQYDIEVLVGSFDTPLPPATGKFDLIIMSHVLEHLLDPKLALSTLSKHLATDGLLYVEVPNLLRPFVPTGYFSFEHLNYFTPTTLGEMLKSCSFTQSISLYDNSADIDPFFPVIAACSKTCLTNKCENISDYNDAYNAVSNYTKQSINESTKIQKVLYSIFSQTPKPRVALWGAGIHTSQLLALPALKSEVFVCVFDNDPKKHGKKINNVEILKPPPVSLLSSFADVIIISSKASQNEIYEQLKVAEKYSVKICKLYP